MVFNSHYQALCYVGGNNIYMPDDLDSINEWAKLQGGHNYFTPGEAPPVQSLLLRVSVAVNPTISNIRNYTISDIGNYLADGLTQAWTQFTQYTQAAGRRRPEEGGEERANDS